MKQNLILIGAGAVTEAAYLGVTLRLPWWRYGGVLQSWRDLLSVVDGAFLFCLAGALLLLIAYVVGWHAVRGLSRRQHEQPGRVVWTFALLYSATLFWLMPITSDLFNYLGQAHLFTDLNANPLLEPAIEVNQAIVSKDGAPDPLLSTYTTVYSGTPSIYGPGWTLVSAPATWLSSSYFIGLLYLKGLAWFAFLVSAWLVRRIVERLRPSSAIESLYLFAWNPLVLLMAVGDGHNDMVMMAAVLLGFWFLLRNSWAWAFAALAFSASIKYVGALFVPLFALYAWERSRSSQRYRLRQVLLQGGLAAAAVIGLVYVPLGSAEWGLGLFNRLLRPENWAWNLGSLQFEGYLGVGRGLGLATRGLQAWPPSLVLVAGLGIFAVTYLVLTARLALGMNRAGCNRYQPGKLGWRLSSLRNRRAQQLLDAGFVVSLLLFVLGAARSQPWHLIWPASLAGLSARRWAWAPVIVLSAVMLLSQIWIEWGTPDIVILFSEVV